MIDVNHNILKHFDNELEKGRGNLVPQQRQVTNSKTGKTYTKTVWVNPDDSKEATTPVGEQMSPEIGGMQITKYSDKAVLITGDTYVNKDDLTSCKARYRGRQLE